MSRRQLQPWETRFSPTLISLLAQLAFLPETNG